jgi:hypothetical protein
MYTHVLPSDESLTNCVSLLWIEVGQPWCTHRSITRTNGRSLRTFQKSNAVSEIGGHWMENYFHLFNPLNAELNSICHLLALLGGHLIFHVSKIRVKLKIWRKIGVRWGGGPCKHGYEPWGLTKYWALLTSWGIISLPRRYVCYMTFWSWKTFSLERAKWQVSRVECFLIIADTTPFSVVTMRNVYVIRCTHFLATCSLS